MMPETVRPVQIDAREMTAGAGMGSVAGPAAAEAVLENVPGKSRLVEVVALMNTSCEERFEGIDGRPRRKSSAAE